MSFFSQFFKRATIKEERYLVLDIGSQTVNSLFVLVSRGKGKIVSAAKILRLEAKPSEGVLANPAELVSTCAQVIRWAGASSLKDAKTIIGVSGGAIRGEVTSHHFEREDPKEKIDLLELKNIIHKIQWRAYEKIKRKLSLETGYSEREIRLLNASLQQISVDGYVVSDPLGLRGKEIAISIFNSYAPQSHLDVIEEIGRKLRLNIFYVVSEGCALAGALKAEIAGSQGAIVLDVGAALTAVTLIRGGACEGTKIFALGGASFTKKISSELAVGFWEAEEIKLKYSKNQLSQRASQKIAKLFEPDFAVLRAGIEMALLEFSQTEIFPPVIFLVGGASQLKGLDKYLSHYDWTQRLPFREAPEITYLRFEHLANLEDPFSFLKGPEDLPAAGLAGVALKTSLEGDALDKALRRALKMIQFS